MRLLVDSCASSRIAQQLRLEGYDVIWVGDWPQDPGDDEILRVAWAEGRVVITLDKDFGDLAVHRSLQHHGILRLVDLPLAEQAQRCARALQAHGPELAGGGIVTLERGRTRVRPASPS